MNDFVRLDRVLSHLRRFSTHDNFYRSLLRQYDLLHRLSEKQIQAVEKNMASDLKWLHDWDIYMIEKWNKEHHGE